MTGRLRRKCTQCKETMTYMNTNLDTFDPEQETFCSPLCSQLHKLGKPGSMSTNAPAANLPFDPLHFMDTTEVDDIVDQDFVYSGRAMDELRAHKMWGAKVWGLPQPPLPFVVPWREHYIPTVRPGEVPHASLSMRGAYSSHAPAPHDHDTGMV